MKIIQTYKADLLNGEGLRNVYFFSGCEHHCSGCFNQETWDPDMPEAREWTETDMNQLLEDAKPDYISGITLTGGDPFHPVNIDGIINICKKFKDVYPNKTIWIYTGYRWEDILELKDSKAECLKYIDILCDGKFKEKKKSPDKPWVGSSNQRVIDVKKSLINNQIILY